MNAAAVPRPRRDLSYAPPQQATPPQVGPEEKPATARSLCDQLRSRTDAVMASMALEDRFHVGEGQIEGNATVTQAEDEQIVALHSDIRLGRGPERKAI